MSEIKKPKSEQKTLKAKVEQNASVLDQPIMPVKNSSYEKISLKMISFLLLFVALVGGLFAFSFTSTVPSIFIKSAIIFISIFTALALFALHSLRRNELVLPNNPITYIAFLIPVSYLISSIFSPSPFISLAGFGFEIGTTMFVLAMAVLTLLVSLIIRKKTHVFWYQFAVLVVAIILFLLQALRIFFPSVLNISNILTTPLSSFVGNINDLGVFFGVVVLLALSIIEFTVWGKIGKIIGMVGLVASLIGLALVGFSYLWLVIGIFSLVIFVALFSFSAYFAPEAKGNKLSYTALSVVVISAIFLIFGTGISNTLKLQLGIDSSREIYPPSFEQTMPIVSSAVNKGTKEALFGIGPNRFVTEWLKEKPTVANYLSSWDVDFNYGNSVLLTNIVTNGIVGALAWIAVFLVIIFTGFKYVFFKPKSGLTGFVTFSTFLTTLYLWITLAIHVPSAGMLTFIFFSTGMFASSLYASDLIPSKKYLFASSPMKSFFVVLAMVFILIASFALDYLSFAKVYASHSYNKALSLANKGSFTEGRAYMSKAISFGGSDIYHRGLADIAMMELRARSGEFSSKPNESQAQVKGLMDLSAGSLQNAISIDPSNYQNYMSFGHLYKMFVSPKSLTTFDYAKTAYKKALEYAPKNPSIYLSIAKLEFASGNTLGAEENIRKALDLKPNYTGARYEWSQMQIASNDINGAIKTMEEASLATPYDMGIRFQLGLLKYEKKQYSQAISNFEEVIKYIPDHANARYYLALSYAKMGRFSDALKELYAIEKTNKGNELLTNTIAEIEAEQIPSDIETEELPIEEEN